VTKRREEDEHPPPTQGGERPWALIFLRAFNFPYGSDGSVVKWVMLQQEKKTGGQCKKGKRDSPETRHKGKGMGRKQFPSIDAFR